MEFLATAMEAARKAGEVQLKHIGEFKSIGFKDVKGKNDIVTKVDTDCETLIINTIKDRYPEHSVLAEEGTADSNNADSEYRWIIDPLDGTMNYSNEFPFFCVSIALEYKNEIVLGVIYEPVRDEMFSAEKGKGAWLNGKGISVSETNKIENCFVVCGTFYYHDKPLMEKHLSILREVNLKVRGVRRDGSAALDLCYVACGRYDAFWECGLKAWDVAAGGLIITEAGGEITDYKGDEFSIFDAELLTSNGIIHDQFVQIMNNS